MKPLPKFTAVVHVAADVQAIVQTALALEHGAQGVFLINHDAPTRLLLATYLRVRQEFPDAWIGLNFLDLDALEACATVPDDADGLWADNMGAARLCHWDETNWRFFPGTAFKYQPHIGSVATAAEIAARRLRPTDVITTSGPGTGQAASLGKLEAMKGASMGNPLALASGVTPDNAASFLPFVDCFLVATGISRNFHEFDAGKVRDVADILTAP